MPATKQRRQYFDEDIPEDVQAVLDVSALLGVSEFRMFHIAYRQWYGHDGDEAVIERYFIPYMFHDRVPPWVRHFAQRVKKLDHAGKLDLAEFGIVRRAATAQQVHRGRAYALGLFTVMVMLVLLAELAGKSACLFPPCY